MEGLGLNLGYLIVQIVNFIILLIILRAWVYKPIVNMLKKRQASIAQGLEDARVAAEARAHAEEEARQLLAKAQVEAADKVREATMRAESASQQIRRDAEAEAEKIRESATSDAAMERNRILADMRGQVAALAMAAAQKLIGEALDEKRQRALIDNFFSGLKAGKVIVLDDVVLRGSSAEIISALPLTEAEKVIVQKDIASRIGAQDVSFRVDPNILGGLIVRVGDKVLDGSVAGQLGNLRQSLS